MSDFKKNFLFIKDIEEYPSYCSDTNTVYERGPGFGKGLNESTEEEIRGTVEVNDPSGKVNGYGVQSYHNKEESPFPEVPNVDYQVEYCKE